MWHFDDRERTLIKHRHHNWFVADCYFFLSLHLPRPFIPWFIFIEILSHYIPVGIGERESSFALKEFKMDPITTATLGDPDFPPKNGVIIKQGALFIQESRRILFMKWKVSLRFPPPLGNTYHLGTMHNHTNTLALFPELWVDNLHF